MASRKESALTKRTKILLVEDNDVEAFLLSLVMTHEQRAQFVGRSRDGEEAVAYLSGAGIYADRKIYPFPDVVLLDLNMPRLNGFEVLEWLHTQPDKPEVVVFTSSQREDDRARCLALGAGDFIIKPVDLNDLKAVVSRVVARAHEKRAAQQGTG